MKRVLTGIKPTGNSLTLGNYIGGILPALEQQEENDLFIFIADLHALTLPIDANELRDNIKNLLVTYLASGLNPDKCTIFKQSDISAHNQLEWILTCNVSMSELSVMHQYKTKSQQLVARQGIPSALFNYPTLMAADILLYDSEFVTCGQDQLQHIELTHTIADRFNNRYGKTFILPNALINQTNAKIMSLSDPTKKMSKSESDKGTIYLSDTADIIRKKIRKAMTDDESKIYYDVENKPGISNLLNIMSSLTKKTIKELEEIYKDERDYGKFKNDVADVVVNTITTLQENMNTFNNDENLRKILVKGKLKAESIANSKIQEVYKKIGLK